MISGVCEFVDPDIGAPSNLVNDVSHLPVISRVQEGPGSSCAFGTENDVHGDSSVEGSGGFTLAAPDVVTVFAAGGKGEAGDGGEGGLAAHGDEIANIGARGNVILLKINGPCEASRVYWAQGNHS